MYINVLRFKYLNYLQSTLTQYSDFIYFFMYYILIYILPTDNKKPQTQTHTQNYLLITRNHKHTPYIIHTLANNCHSLPDYMLYLYVHASLPGCVCMLCMYTRTHTYTYIIHTLANS